MMIARPHRSVTASLWRRVTMVLLAFLLIVALAPVSALADPHTPELDRTGGETEEETESLNIDFDRTSGGDSSEETDSLNIDFDRTGGSDVDPELAALGITGPTSYASPQFGYRVEWSGSWELDISDGFERVISSDTSTTPPRDALTLRSMSEDASLLVSGYTKEGFGSDPDGTIPQQHVELIEAYAAGKQLRNSGIDSVELLLADYDDDYGSVVYFITWDNGDQFLFYNQIQVIGDYVVRTLLTASPGPSFLSAYVAAIDEIEVAGDPAFPFLDRDDVEEVVLDFLDDFASEAGKNDTDGAASAAYLDDVSDHVDELQASYDLFLDILSTEGPLSEADGEALNDILLLWRNAPGVAEDLEPPAALEELHEVYLDYTDALADMGASFMDFVRSEPDSAAEADAIAAFQSARAEVEDLGEELTDLLADAGA